ncbi:MAG: class B sortase [Oscillospiraceae bacterium]|nr:class B sortase [Oscillospiraceae bacterium]
MSSKALHAGKRKFSYKDVLRDLFPCKGDSAAEAIRKIIFMISVITFSVCAYFVFDYFYENYTNNKLYEPIQAKIPSFAEMLDDSPSNTIKSEEVLDCLKQIISINDDVVGYIQIADKESSQNSPKLISYPIVQKKNEAEREFYLDHNIEKAENRAGSIFLDWRVNFGTQDQSDNVIIYGHEMKDGSMFGSLKKYYENYDFYGQHPCIELATRYQISTYKIFGVFYADGGTDDSQFHYYNNIDFSDEENFFWYINEIKRRSFILNDVDMQYGDELLTLSTCATGSYDDARFVVAARKVRNGEDKYAGTENNSRNPNPLMPDGWYQNHGGSYDRDAEFVPYT